MITVTIRYDRRV